MKGAFIVFEGIDGTGKSSVCTAVSESLSRLGYDAVTTYEPTPGPIGSLVRSEGFGPLAEALLFAADRAEHTVWVMGRVREGKVVLCDRYFASSLAYQSAAGADPGWIRGINAPGMVEPDLTILMDAPVSVGMGRVGFRGEATRFEDPGYLEKVRSAYLDYARETGCAVLDATAPEAEVAERALKLVLGLLEGI
ncbi:MAG: dTMP kinase [Thermoplasmatales archaeon]|nr:dTMP kinase [Thermoplasmatales archaeon]